MLSAMRLWRRFLQITRVPPLRDQPKHGEGAAHQRESERLGNRGAVASNLSQPGVMCGRGGVMGQNPVLDELRLKIGYGRRRLEVRKRIRPCDGARRERVIDDNRLRSE